LQAELRDLSGSTQEELRGLRETIQRLAYEVQRTQENEAPERKKLELRLEVQRLRAVKQLPQGEPAQDETPPT